MAAAGARDLLERGAGHPGWPEAWDEVRSEWNERRDAALGDLIAAAFGDDGVLFVTLWRRYTELLSAGSAGASGAVAPRATSDGGDSVADGGRTVADLMARARRLAVAGGPEAATALTVTFAYLQALIVWENCDDPLDTIKGFLSEVVEEVGELIGAPPARKGALRSLPFPDPADDPDGLRTVTVAATRLVQALVPQLAVENALFCSCAIDFTRQAGTVTPLADEVRRNLGALRDGQFPGASELARELATLLSGDAESVMDYYSLLHDEVGPAAIAFLQVIEGYGGAVEAHGALLSAVKAGQEKEASLGEDVLATEARAHRLACGAMLDWLSQAADGADSSPRQFLRIDDGEIVLMFSFGLPGVDPDWLVSELVGPVGPSSPHLEPFVGSLGGAPVEWDVVRRTDSWENWSEQTVARRAMRVIEATFSQHELVLETTEPRRYRDLDVAVAISSIGNCYVKVGVSADTRVETVRPEGATGDQKRDEWLEVNQALVGWTVGDELPPGYLWSPDDHQAGLSPHQVDQWTRRAAHQVGTEQLRLVADGTAVPDGPRSVVSFARDLIKDLGHQARSHGLAGPDHEATVGHGSQVDDASGTDASDRTPSPPASWRRAGVDDLDTGSHVVIVAERVSKIWPDGERDPELIKTPGEIAGLFGASALLRPQRPLPSSLEEWVRLPAPTEDELKQRNLLSGIGLPEDHIISTHDTTLMCMLGSPNWAVLPLREIVEFAASLSGIFTAWSLWLRDASSRSTQVLDEHGDHLLWRLEDQARDIGEQLGEVRFVIEHVFSAQLLRTSSERELITRLYHELGHHDYARRLHEAVESLTAQHQLITAQAATFVEHRREAARDEDAKLQDTFGLIVGVVAFAGLAGLFDWVNGSFFQGTAPVAVAWLELGLLVASVAAAIAWIRHRRPSAHRAEPGRPPPGAELPARQNPQLGHDR